MTQVNKPPLYQEPDLLAGTTPTDQPMPMGLPSEAAMEEGAAIVREITTGKEMRGRVDIVNGMLVWHDLEGLQRAARMVMQSGMSPKGAKNLADVCIVLQAGNELGLTLTQTLRFIMIVNGKPVLWGDGALAMCRRSPVCASIVETMTGEGDDRVAKCVCVRKGEPVEIVQTFSVKDAKAAGLWGKEGPWKLYTNRMLKMRARGFALRDAFPDLLLGMGIAEEEMDVQGFDPDRMAINAPSAVVPMPEDAR